MAVPAYAAPRTNLPAQLSTFIGREDELGAVPELLRTARLVTLSGPGGIGKTRLALEVATLDQDRYADGASIIELGPVVDPRFVPQAVASALGIVEEIGRPLVETLQRRLQDSECLLVLDNCEHLVVAAAELTERLLRAAPRLRVLATSREPLGVSGEAVWRVPPLGLAPVAAARRAVLPASSAAERLFVERARAAHPEFDASRAHASAIRSICRRLDGMPLAIELAAAWIGFMNPAQLLNRLERSPGFLRSSDRSAPARHTTMTAAIQWSYDLLAAAERVHFARLSIFSGSFTLEASEAICTDSAEKAEHALALLRQLVNKSFVLTAASTDHLAPVRYRVLEPLRDFGLAILRESDEEARLRQRHAHFYIQLARQSNLVVRQGAGGPWLEPLARDHDNLNAALRWLLDYEQVEGAQEVGIAVAEVWRQRGQLGEARTLISQLLRMSDADEPSVPRAGLLLLAGQLATFQGDNASARVLLEDSVAHCRELGLAVGVARAVARLADVERALGHYVQAHLLVDEGVRVAPAVDERDGPGFQAACRFWHALVDLDEGTFDRAAALAEELLPVLDQSGWTRIAAHALNVLGVCAGQRGNFTEARLRLEQSLARWTKSDSWGTARALVELGRIALMEGDVDQTANRLRQALELSRDMGDPTSLAAALDVRAALAATLGHPDRAVRLVEAAAAVRDRSRIVESPRESAWRRQHIGSLERLLRRNRYAAERQAGRAMTSDQVFDLALSQDRDNRPVALTARERDVARLLALGWTDAQIADELVISPRTAEVHVRNILGKLGLSSRAQVAVWAVDHGLREPDPDRIGESADLFT
jgi:predicted ATPase/DNA-binding CsgD family transcriptional regulator